MEERESIALNVQLPAGTLEGLTRLVEQLRYLAAEVNRGRRAAAPAEAGENPAFDWARYQGLERGPAAVPPGEAVPPEAAQAALTSGPAGPDSAGWEPSDTPPQAAGTESGSVSPVEEGENSLPSMGEERADSSAPPAAESAGMQDLRDTAAGRTPEVMSSPAPVDAAPEAGFAFSAGMESGGGRGAAVAEELVWKESAPLTAQAVSQAFRRDGRRYDNAFPLY